jgi:hypothetical protein
MALSDSKNMHSQIQADREAAFPKGEAPLVNTYRRYTRGRQNQTLTTEQVSLLKGVLGNRFCDNICKLVVSETANRLELLRFSVADDNVDTFLNTFFVKNALADFSSDVHFSTVRDGNFAVVLGWDSATGRVILNKEQWWNGKTGIFVAYGPTNMPAYAVKDWTNQDGKQRRVIWFPDAIYRFILAGAVWEPYFLPGDTAWPMPWTRPDGSPLGLPVVHFGNGSDNDTPYGASTLEGGVIGLQDEVNDAQRNITTAGRLTGAQMMYATGISLLDEDGIETKLRVGPGAIFSSDNANAKFGVLPAGDLSQLEKAYMIKLQAIARMTSTPMHLITGQWPSGEALLQAQKPLIQKVYNLAKTIGPAWATVAHRATEMANVFSKAGLDEKAMITSVFAPPEQNDPVTQTAIANGRAALISKQEGLRILGYSPEQIKQIIAELKEEASLFPAPVVNGSPAPVQVQAPATAPASLPAPVPVAGGAPTLPGQGQGSN